MPDRAPRRGGTIGLTPGQIAETAFEKRRGISDVEVRPGYAQAFVSGLPDPLSESRLRVLRRVADEGISIDFLKLTQEGLSFVVRDDLASRLPDALAGEPATLDVRSNRHIVLVHAVNMRDEEGLIAGVLQRAIATGIELGHVTDMHDRMLMVVDAADSDCLRNELLAFAPGGSDGH